jgi:hypothetical protein
LLLATYDISDYSTYYPIFTMMPPAIENVGRTRRHLKAFNTKRHGAKQVSNKTRKLDPNSRAAGVTQSKKKV